MRLEGGRWPLACPLRLKSARVLAAAGVLRIGAGAHGRLALRFAPRDPDIDAGQGKEYLHVVYMKEASRSSPTVHTVGRTLIRPVGPASLIGTNCP